MPGHTNQNEKNYRDMMKRLEKINAERAIKGNENMAVMGNMGGNALTDREVVFNAMKALDPRSVMREGDEMVSMKTGGPADFLTAMQEKGETLTEEQRSILMDMTKDIATDRMRAKDVNPKDVVREGEMMGLSMADRDAIEALTSMGISLEDAVEAILDPNAVARRDEMLEGAVGATMGAGALGALPMRKPSTVMREGEMGADRTQSMDMQKEGMGT